MSVHERAYELTREIQRLGSHAARLVDRKSALFEYVSLEMPKLAPAEIGFLRAVSWLYVHYFEAGNIGVKFLVRKFEVYSIDSTRAGVGHQDIVQRLRTYLQHNLDPHKERGAVIQRACSEWFAQACGTVDPSAEEEWQRCLLKLLDDALKFIEALSSCVRQIERDESREMMLEQWRFALDRHFPPYKFDELVAKVASDLGRADDPQQVRLRYYDKWNKELSLKSGDWDPATEARKLIEHALLNEMTNVLPITGADIIQRFGIRPGPRVGEILKQARQLYSESPCARDELIAKLAELVS